LSEVPQPQESYLATMWRGYYKTIMVAAPLGALIIVVWFSVGHESAQPTPPITQQQEAVAIPPVTVTVGAPPAKKGVEAVHKPSAPRRTTLPEATSIPMTTVLPPAPPEEPSVPIATASASEIPSTTQVTPTAEVSTPETSALPTSN
jgi:hypothetical protein